MLDENPEGVCMILVKIFSIGFLVIASAICYEILALMNREPVFKDWLYKVLRIGIIAVWVAVFCMCIILVKI